MYVCGGSRVVGEGWEQPLGQGCVGMWMEERGSRAGQIWDPVLCPHRALLAPALQAFPGSKQGRGWSQENQVP
jgi:hypothetical protein